ncbi:MAG: tetratricopeptide repeat protein [Thermodesulfobacteriota bacterium]
MSNKETPNNQLLYKVQKGDGLFSSPYLFPIIIVALTAVAYLPAFGAGYIWDDNHHVFANPHLLDPNGIWRIWFTRESQQYYPLVYSSFWLEYRIFGASPAVYHTVNILLHSVNAVLVWVVLSRLGLRWAAAAALVFALHPVHVESVAWISERKNVLSALFYLLSLHMYLTYEDRKDKKTRNRAYIFSLFFFLFSLLSKTVVCTLPVAIIVIDWMRGGGGRRINKEYILRLVPFFIVGLVMGLVTVWWEVHQVGASGAEWEMGVAEKLLLPGRVAWFYFLKLTLPLKLTFIYPRFTLDPTSFAQWLFPITLIAVFILLYIFKKRIGRAPVAALAFFIVTLFPALGFFNVYPFRYSFVADHFQYLASLGIICTLVGFASFLLTKFVGNKKTVHIAVTIIVLIPLLILTFLQCRVYKDEETLWTDVLEKNPTAWIAYNNLGAIYLEHRDVNEAVDAFNRSLSIWSGNTEAHLNLGSTFLALARYERAETHYREALRIDPELPRALSGLSVTLAYVGRINEAYEAGKKAVSLGAGNAIIHNGFGIVLERAGKRNEAIEQYRLAIKSAPGFAQAYNNLGVALTRSGSYADAISSFQKAVEINPTYAEGHYNLGVVLSGLGRLQEAEELLLEAIRLNDKHARAHSKLGTIYLETGRVKEAQDHFLRALKINPNLTNAQKGLKQTLETQNKL